MTFQLFSSWPTLSCSKKSISLPSILHFPSHHLPSSSSSILLFSSPTCSSSYDKNHCLSLSLQCPSFSQSSKVPSPSSFASKVCFWALVLHFLFSLPPLFSCSSCTTLPVQPSTPLFLQLNNIFFVYLSVKSCVQQTQVCVVCLSGGSSHWTGWCARFWFWVGQGHCKQHTSLCQRCSWSRLRDVATLQGTRGKMSRRSV